jgi:hypothetical protein
MPLGADRAGTYEHVGAVVEAAERAGLARRIALGSDR